MSIATPRSSPRRSRRSSRDPREGGACGRPGPAAGRHARGRGPARCLERRSGIGRRVQRFRSDAEPDRSRGARQGTPAQRAQRSAHRRTESPTGSRSGSSAFTRSVTVRTPSPGPGTSGSGCSPRRAGRATGARRRHSSRPTCSRRPRSTGSRPRPTSTTSPSNGRSRRPGSCARGRSAARSIVPAPTTTSWPIRSCATKASACRPSPGPGRERSIRLAGIPIRVEPAFVLVLGLLGFAGRGTLLAAVEWVVLAGISVLLHELGHAAAYRRFGIQPSIRLWSFGGLTYGEALSPARSIIVSLAGPVTGLLVGAAVAAVSWVAGSVMNTGSPEFEQVVADLLYINIAWSLFNLLPVLPLDGGNVAAAAFRAAGRGEAPATILSLVVGGVDHRDSVAGRPVLHRDPWGLPCRLELAGAGGDARGAANQAAGAGLEPAVSRPVGRDRDRDGHRGRSGKPRHPVRSHRDHRLGGSRERLDGRRSATPSASSVTAPSAVACSEPVRA